jgi:hypothetical protein
MSRCLVNAATAVNGAIVDDAVGIGIRDTGEGWRPRRFSLSL